MSSNSNDDQDELDRLTKLYETQAKEDAVKAQDASRSAKRHKIMPSGAGPKLSLHTTARAAPLPPENKGFQLLARMGYEPGSSIGKTTIGVTEPVAVEFKPNRLGIGAVSKKAIQRGSLHQREEETELGEKVEKERLEEELAQQREEYREQLAINFATRQKESDLKLALKAFDTFETRRGMEMNPLWIQGGSGEGQEEDNLDREAWWQLPIEERLNEVLSCLRQVHFYCIYCGVEFENEVDMAANCPGASESNH